MVGNNNKPQERKGTVLFINGKDDVIDNKGLAYLTPEHIDKFYKAFKAFEDIPYYAKVASLEDILLHNGNMNINFYVKRENSNADLSFGKAFREWNESRDKLNESMIKLFEVLQ